MTTDPTNRVVSCPACRGDRQIVTPTCRGILVGRHHKRVNVCPTCLGHGTVHPLKARQYEKDRDPAHLVKITHQKT